MVLAAVILCMMAGTGLRSSFGVYIKPMEAEFGWSRGALSGVAAVSLVILGAVGPFVGRLADRWGPPANRRLLAPSAGRGRPRRLPGAGPRADLPDDRAPDGGRCRRTLDRHRIDGGGPMVRAAPPRRDPPCGQPECV